MERNSKLIIFQGQGQSLFPIFIYLPVFEVVLGMRDGGWVPGEGEEGGGVTADLQQVRRRGGACNWYSLSEVGRGNNVIKRS